MIKLIEIFASIQGESTYAGLPCIFIRFAECNLRCNYCDSKYTYITRFKKSIEEILSEIENWKHIKLVEITGGEPLLQKEIYPLFQALHLSGYKILLETNGSMSLKEVPEYVVKIIDVKCKGSGEENSFLTENLLYINGEKDEIKFVLSDRKDFDFAVSFIIKKQLQNNKIIFSTVFNRLEPQTLADWILKSEINVRLQLQMHKYIWDPEKEGV